MAGATTVSVVIQLHEIFQCDLSFFATMAFTSLLFILFAVVGASAQGTVSPFSIYNQTGRLPAGCVGGYSAGTDTVIYNVPYTYTQVMSIIGSFKNLTWSGNPDNTVIAMYTKLEGGLIPGQVTLNGTNNQVGTARTYTTAGAYVVETITVYDKPAAGPYDEVHTLAPLSIPIANLSFYSAYDGTVVTPICGGTSSQFNFTINFCATNATLAASVLHMIHLTDATTVGVILGNHNFTSCAATNSTFSGGSNTTTGSTPKPSTFNGGASLLHIDSLIAGLGALAAVLI